MKTEIETSIFIGTISSLYYIPEIIAHFPSWTNLFLSILVQITHDAVCILFLIVFIRSIWTHSIINVLFLNIMHCLAMALFAYYKRCILTLIYNDLLLLPSCRRYIPIWQRIINYLSSEMNTKDVQCVIIHDFHNTYLWLNDHIIKSIIVCIANMKCLYKYKMIS